MTTKPLNTLQAGRGLAALAVLLFHTNLTLSLPKYLGVEIAPIFRSGNSGVQFFFVLSGFVILLAHQRDVGVPAKLGSFLWKRFRRVYPPLWIVLLLVTPIFFLYPNFGDGSERHFVTILCAFLIAPSINDSLLSPEWTLRHEVLFYAVFALLLWRKRLGYAVLGSWMLASAIVPLFHLAPEGLSAFFFSSNHLLFGFGMLVCIVFRRAVSSTWLAWCSAVVGILLYAGVWTTHAFWPDLILNELVLLYGFSAALMIAGLISLERMEHIHTPWVLTYLGEASYAVYLIHFPVVSLACKVVAHSRMRTHNIICFLIVAVAALVAGIVFHEFLEKPLTGRLSSSGEKGSVPSQA